MGQGVDPETGEPTYGYSGLPTNLELAKVAEKELLLPVGVTLGCKFQPISGDHDARHGTSVLGIVVADIEVVHGDNNIDATGISWGAGAEMVPACTDGRTKDLENIDVAAAIDLSVEDASPGDVILVEVSSSAVCDDSNNGDRFNLVRLNGI